MNENLNLVELLKDCPKGTKFYSTIYGDVYFEEISDEHWHKYHPIRITIDTGTRTGVTIQGLHNIDYKGECTLFPSKDQRDWSKWHRPFKECDVIISDIGDIHLLRTSDSSYCAYREHWMGISKFDSTMTTNIKVYRLATKEEEQKLFDAIKANGYTWNFETKTLEKIHKDRFKPLWFKPFNKVLVRDVNNEYWKINLFGSYMRGWKSPFLCVGKEGYRQCIPYEGNEHLLGTTNDCNNFFKIWED